jgi:hypothetical protein
MALIGGGGAGNVAGGNPSGIGKGLSYMGGGVHAGWSGTVNMGGAGSPVTQFEFVNGSAALIADYVFGVEGNTLDSNVYYGFQITMDGQLVYEQTGRNTTNTNNIIGQPFNFVIPAFSKIKIESRTTDSSGDTPTYGMLTCKEIGYNA